MANQMNKLFIIGNGFDRSLGMKTKYEDFILWIFTDAIRKAIDGGYREVFPINRHITDYSSKVKVAGFHENDLLKISIANVSNDQLENIVKRFKNIETLKEEIKHPLHLNIKIKSSIITYSISQMPEKWVDIETYFFDHLKKLYHEIVEAKKHLRAEKLEDCIKRVLSNVNSLNEQINNLSNSLKKYLDDEAKLFEPAKKGKPHIEQFTKPLNVGKYEFETGQTCFLNFNYTDALSKILTADKNTIINPIHGTIHEAIIFGYGDEMDPAYKQMEELNENCFFEHIKSFGYFKNDRYRQLLGFMASGKFQVGIYGHSCGLSDRVLLNEIFEHENCHSIRVYHIGEKDYINKTMEISRHFNSNQLLRNRILPYNPMDFIPQV